MLLFGLQILAAQPRKSFDVASVKLHVPAEGPQTTTMQDEPGALHYSNVALKSCILAAYGIRDSQLEGLEGHQPERYDIEAKSDTHATGPALMELLQTLLEDRFRLRFHMRMKEMPVYHLVRGKTLRVSPGPDPDSGIDFSGGSDQRITVRASLQHFADFLSGFSDRPVLDKTGLEGAFTIRLEWTAGANRQDTQDTLFATIEQQLGLQLEPGSDSVKTIVIDHVERLPTPN